MNALHLNQAIVSFFDRLSNAQPFIDGLAALANHADVINGPLAGIAAGGNKLTEGAANLNAHFSSLSAVTSKISNRHFFRAVESFEQGLSLLQSEWSTDGQPFSRLRHKVEEFADLYDKFLAHQSALNAYPLIFLAQSLHLELQVFLELLDSVRSALGPEDAPSSYDTQISLVLPEHFSLKSFAERLLALQSMYSELCALFDVSEIDHPLRIGKVESGSLWALLFGNTKIVEMMASFIGSGASWAYRNYTTEGKISSLPRKVEAIDSILGLSQRLENSGFDVSGMKPNIEKAAISLSKDLTTLIDGQASITVNDEKLSVQAELTKALLESNEVRRLGITSNFPPESPTVDKEP